MLLFFGVLTKAHHTSYQPPNIVPTFEKEIKGQRGLVSFKINGIHYENIILYPKTSAAYRNLNKRPTSKVTMMVLKYLKRPCVPF